MTQGNLQDCLTKYSHTEISLHLRGLYRYGIVGSQIDISMNSLNPIRHLISLPDLDKSIVLPVVVPEICLYA